MHASVVDRLVKHPDLAFAIRQVRHGFVNQTFHLDVAPAVHHVAVQVVGIVPPSYRAVGVEPTRLGHFHHNLAALKVFAQRQAQSVAQLVQRLRVRDGRSARHGAVALFQLEFRPMRELPTHDDIPHCTLKAQVVRLEYAAVSDVVQQCDRIGVSVTPFVNRVVAVELVPEPPRVRGQVRAVLMHASLFQVSRRPTFKVQMHRCVHGWPLALRESGRIVGTAARQCCAPRLCCQPAATGTGRSDNYSDAMSASYSAHEP